MIKLALICSLLAPACSATDKRLETQIAACVAADAIELEQAITGGTFSAYVETHGAEFALCAARAWSNRNAAAATPTTSK